LQATLLFSLNNCDPSYTLNEAQRSCRRYVIM